MLLPNSIIITKDKIKEIKDIKKNDLILTDKGIFKPVKNIFIKNYSGNIYKIKLSHLNFITASFTEDHIIFTNNGIKNVKELSTSDYLKIPKIKENENITEINLGEYISDNIKCIERDNRFFIPHGKMGAVFSSSVPKKIKLTNDLLWLLGFIIAEGCIINNNSTIDITLGPNDKKFIKKCMNILSDLGLSRTLMKRKNSKCWDIMIYNKLLNNILGNMIYIGAKNKKFPNFVFNLNNNQIKSLLKGYWSGDGWYEKIHKRIAIATVSKSLAFYTSLLLIKLNLIPSLYMQIRKPHIIKESKVNSSLIYNVYTLSDPNNFLEDKNKQYYKSRIDNNYAYFKINNIEQEQYSGPVYNLEIEDIHSFSVPYIISDYE